MMRSPATPTNNIKKLHLEAVVLFASGNIPEVDPATLNQFWELVNADGTFGSISREEILKKMCLVLKYIPDACPHSLMVLMDLLGIKPANYLVVSALENGQPESKVKSDGVAPFFVEIQPVVQPLGP